MTDGVFILNACEVTVTAGWCPTKAPATGVDTAPPGCCFSRHGATAPRRCYCSTGRPGVTRVAPGGCPAVRRFLLIEQARGLRSPSPLPSSGMGDCSHRARGRRAEVGPAARAARGKVRLQHVRRAALTARRCCCSGVV